MWSSLHCLGDAALELTRSDVEGKARRPDGLAGGAIRRGMLLALRLRHRATFGGLPAFNSKMYMPQGWSATSPLIRFGKSSRTLPVSSIGDNRNNL